MTLSDEFSRTRFDAIEAAIVAGDAAEVRRLGDLARAEYVAVHDGLRDVVGATLDFAVRASSPEEGEAVGRRVIEGLMGAGAAPQYNQADLAGRVRSIAAGWHWHATTFHLSEDDEKLTFRLDPCGSGMRLELDGRYDGDDGWLRSVRPSPSTFMQSGFPLYSNHCAEMTRAGLAAGNATFVVEGWRGRECGLCFQHTYKRLDAVPVETYRRVGLEPSGSQVPASELGRLFTEDELAELATHPLERAARAVTAGDAASAHEALGESREAWGVAMHGAYRRWISMLWREVVAVLGEPTLTRVLAATTPELVRHRRGGSVRDWAAFWSMHLGLRAIHESEAEVAFVIDPSALLEEDAEGVGPGPEALVRGLRDGLASRRWSDAGSFSTAGGAVVHTVAATR